MVGFDLGGVENAQEDCKVGPHAEEEPNMDCESEEERTENVSGCCRSLARHRKPSGNAMWCRTCRSEIGADIVWPGGVSNIGIKGIQGTMTNIRLCALIMGI